MKCTPSLQNATDYKIILSGVRGDAQTKRLSSQFVARFFTKFPNLANESLDAILDLCEDDDVNIRKQAIKVNTIIHIVLKINIPKHIKPQLYTTDSVTCVIKCSYEISLEYNL